MDGAERSVPSSNGDPGTRNKEEVANNFPISYLQENDDGWPGAERSVPGCERLRIPGHAALCPGHTAEKSGSYYSPIPESGSYCSPIP